MKLRILFLLLIMLTQNISGQDQQNSFENISDYFDEIRVATKKSSKLWNFDLYHAILLVEPKSRQIFSNESDSANILKPNGNIYSGILPDDINIANTSLNWSGKRWAMIMLPLPKNKQDRINLLVHELFHTAQPSLGFTLYNPENNHLDQKDGRVYLRLELEALKKAVRSSSKKELKRHLKNALAFRKYRHQLYNGSQTTENLLELNEGIAEFTGLIVSDRSKKQVTEHFVNSINSFLSNPTFVRSFAYQTIPIYGYLLSSKRKNWNKDITDKTDLTSYFIKAFDIDLSGSTEDKIESLSESYNGKIIIQEEKERQEKAKKIVAEYKLKFIEQPHFEIQFEKMNVSFDPRNIIPVEDKGTVYPNIRVTDLWGILTVENGALMSTDWSKISITNPTKTDGNKIYGNGWILELKDGYTVQKNGAGSGYKLTKK
ncbi:MAG: hypothetical protein K0R36_3776 [Chryseobacterium sp.]|nr:hypothetical protein [Chryseobacterium sp.]